MTNQPASKNASLGSSTHHITQQYMDGMNLGRESVVGVDEPSEAHAGEHTPRSDVFHARFHDDRKNGFAKDASEHKLFEAVVVHQAVS